MSRSARALFACVGAFVILELVAMRLYPGGTFWDRTTRGACFWRNFLCDFGSPVALDGAPNAVGARFGQTALVVLAVGLAPFWRLAAELFDDLRALAAAVRGLGLASLGAIAAVVSMPSSRFGALHGFAVIAAAVPGLTAALLAVVGLTRAEPRPRIAARLGGATLATAVVDFALYVRTMRSGGPGPTLLPVAQKLALILLLAWMLAVAWKAGRRPDRGPPSTRAVTSARP